MAVALSPVGEAVIVTAGTEEYPEPAVYTTIFSTDPETTTVDPGLAVPEFLMKVLSGSPNFATTRELSANLAVVTAPSASFSFVTLRSEILAVVTGGIYGMSLLVEAVTGRVLCSGYNGYGQLSQGNTTGRTSLGFFLKSAGTPIGIGAEGKIIKALASGEGSYGFSVLLTDTGKVFTAGYNGVGQLGNNSTTATNSGFATEVISSLVTDIYVSTGNTSGGYVMAKKSDGSLWAWGSNNVGNFGAVGSGGALNNVNGTPTRVWNPATYGVATKVVLCGSDNNYSSYVLSQTGIIYSAGLNTYGQQSNANNNNVAVWAPMSLNPGTSSVVDFRADSYGDNINPRILMSDGKVYSCGYNANGQLGNSGTISPYYNLSNMLF